VRRLLVVCAVTVLIYAAFAAGPTNSAGTASAAGSGSGAVMVPDPPGCPLGPSFTFCNQVPGLTSVSEDFLFTLAHATNGLTFSFAAVPGYPGNFAAGDFSILSTTCNAKLNAGDTCNFVVLFTPTTVGLRQTRLTITNPTGDITHMNLEGTGSNLAIQRPALPVVQPPAIPPVTCTQDNAFTYCDQALKTQSGVQTFTLTSANAITGLNIALAAVPGLTSEFNALNPDFTIEGTSTCGNALGAGLSCTIDVEFTPQTAGLREAALTATDDQGDSVNITLAGHTTSNLTIAPPVGYANNCFPAAGFQLCTEPTAGSAPPKTLILTNNSGATVTGLAFPAPLLPVDFPVVNQACTAMLAPGASCTFGIGFTPQGTGLRQAPVSITDAQGDVATANFAGTGDDFSLEIVPGQPSELSVIPGGTVTYKAQANADGIFGQNGEQLSLVCPSNLPNFTTCAFNPCPVSMTPGTATPFGIVIVTSSATVPAPPVTSCPGNSNANTAPGEFDEPRGPSLVFQVAPRAAQRVMRFPSPAILCLVLLATIAAMAFALFGARVSPRRRVPIVFGIAGLAAAILLGCGGHGNAVTTATPTGPPVVMTILANAVDSSGNPINASRAFQITLDVVTK